MSGAISGACLVAIMLVASTVSVHCGEADKNKTAVRRIFGECWNQGDLTVARKLVSESYVRHDSNTPGPTSGIEAFENAVTMYRNAFPDIHFTVEDLIAEGDKVVVRWVAIGTHQGELNGIPATGKKATVHGVSIDRLAAGKVVESWVSFSALGLMKQLGVIPSPADNSMTETLKR